MSNSFNFFDKIYCVNLPDSTDRRERVSDIFSDLDILERVVFDYAQPPPKDSKFGKNEKFLPGILGCSLSHLSIFFDAIESGVNNFLIFEDDIQLNLVLNNNKLINYFIEMPSNWDILYLGGKPSGKVKKYSNNLVSITAPMMGTYSYAFRRKAAKDFVDIMFKGMMDNACDTILGEYAVEKNTFCVYPPLFSTRPGMSLIRGSNRDYIKNTEESWKMFA